MAYQDAITDYDDIFFPEQQPQDENYVSFFQPRSNDWGYAGRGCADAYTFPVDDQGIEHSESLLPLRFDPPNTDSYLPSFDDTDSDTCVISTQMQVDAAPYLPTNYLGESSEPCTQDATQSSDTTDFRTTELQQSGLPRGSVSFPLTVESEEAPVESSRRSSLRSSDTQGQKGRPRKRNSPSRFSSDDEEANHKAKYAHSVVERRYRNNLNGKMTQLYRTLLAAEATSRSTGIQSQDEVITEDRLSRVRKSDIMTKAIQYVHQSEVEIRHMSDEIQLLRGRVQGLEKLIQCEDCPVLGNMIALQLHQ